MAVSAKWYGKGLQHLANGAVDWDTDTIKVLLTTSTYTPNQDTHDFRDDVTNEVSGTGYSAGGAALANRTLAYDAASNTVRLDGDDMLWTGASFTCRYAVIYKSRGGAASADELLGYVDFGGDETVSSGNFGITWDATDGVLRIIGA